MRGNEKCREASLFRADGVVKHDANPHFETFWQVDHPVRSIRGGFAHFLDVASTPPHGGGEWLPFVPLVLFVFRSRSYWPFVRCVTTTS